jgi:hypothetical protein
VFWRRYGDSGALPRTPISSKSGFPRNDRCKLRGGSSPESVVADIGAQRCLSPLIARSLFQRSASPADYGRALAQSVPGRMTQRNS